MTRISVGSNEAKALQKECYSKGPRIRKKMHERLSSLFIHSADKY